MKASIGRIVHYRLNASDAEAINRRRVNGSGHGENWPAGAQAHSGNHAQAGEYYPLLVTRVWSPESDSVNGQAFLDGNDSLWVTSAHEGTEPGTWMWPSRVD